MQKIARFIYGQKSFMRKVEMVYYLKKLNNLFFDNSVIFKAELARMFIDSMFLDVDKNLVVTSVLVYSLKKVNSPQERSRILTEKQRDKEFLQKLGFTEDFCRVAMEYNRVNEPEGYERTPEGDVLEIVENFGGMLLHREDRLGFAPKEALEILENTTFKNSDNRFFEDFKFFLDVFESVQGLGLVTKLQRNINKIKRDDISSAVRAIYDHRDNIENVFMLTEHELFEDEISFFNLAKISAKKTVALINYNRKMSLANLGLRNNNN